MKKDSIIYNIFFWVFIFVMIMMAVLSFIFENRLFTLTRFQIVILCLMLVMFLPDRIESLSIGNIIKLKQRVKDRDKHIDLLNEDNRELRNQLVNLVTNNFNNYNETNFNLGKAIVTPSSEKEAEISKADDSSEDISEESNNQDTNGNTAMERIRLNRLLLDELLNLYIQKHNIESIYLTRNVKIQTQFMGEDQIMNSSVLFDGYLKSPFEEQFLVSTMRMGVISEYRIYLMANKVFNYAKANHVKAKLVIIYPSISDKYSERFFNTKRREMEWKNFKSKFAPAIINDILKIEEIEISDDIMNNLLQKVSDEKKQ